MSYSFAIAPRPVSHSSSSRPLYRASASASDRVLYSSVPSIAADRRVRHVVPSARALSGLSLTARPLTPEAVSGRVHSSVQTESYLEDLRAKHKQSSIGLQTDATLDVPSAPLFTELSSGSDAETQLDGDMHLFDFDCRVESLLQVLTENTVEQALMEVLEEEEIKAIEARKREFECDRAVEQAEFDRLYARDQRRIKERQNRKEQNEEKTAADQKEQERFMSASAAKLAVQLLQRDAMAQLERDGYFESSASREVKEQFLPQLIRDTEALLEQYRTAQRSGSAILAAAIDQLSAERRRAELFTIRSEREQRVQLAFRGQPFQGDSVQSQARRAVDEVNQRLRGVECLSEQPLLKVSEAATAALWTGPDAPTEADIAREPNESLDQLALMAAERRRRIAGQINSLLRYERDVILIQSLARGRSARLRVSAIRRDRRLKDSRQSMDPAALLDSLTPDLGLDVSPVDQRSDGLVIARLDTFGSAAQCGLATGDAITRVNGQAVDTVGALAHLLAHSRVGDSWDLTVRRSFDGREEAVSMEVGHSSGTEFPNSMIRELRTEIGLKCHPEAWLENGEAAAALLRKWLPKIADLAVEENKQKDGMPYAPVGGARVTELKPNSTAFAAGLRVGSVILSVNGQRVNTLEAIKKAIKKCEAGELVKVEFISAETIQECQQAPEAERAELAIKQKRLSQVELGAANKRANVELIRALRAMASTAQNEPNTEE